MSADIEEQYDKFTGTAILKTPKRALAEDSDTGNVF